jgi:hypothetical protein
MRCRASGAAAVVTAAVLVGGCTAGEPAARGPAPPPSTPPSSSTPPPSPAAPSGSQAACSGAAAEPVAPQRLPADVATTRAAIAAAARACDYAALEALAHGGERPFTYSFGGGDSPGRFWQAEEERGERPLWTLVEVLRRQFRELPEVGQHVWPAAFGYDDWSSVPQDARDELSGLYGPRELSGFEQFGAYVGYRVGIGADGEWLFFVAGD